MYGPLVITYLFLGGAAAGALFVASTWSLAARRSERLQNPLFAAAFDTMRKHVYAAGFIMLAFAMACLLWDLGSPQRALLVFLRPRPTVLTFGAFTLSVEAGVTAVLASSSLLGKPRLPKGLFTTLEALCCLGALATMGYTGVFLFESGMPAWSTWTLVALFVFSSLSAGISTVLLIDWVAQGRARLLKAAKPLQKAHLACLAGEGAFFTLFMLHVFDDPSATAAKSLIMQQDMTATIALGVVGFGMAVPAALEAYSLTRAECRTIPAADAACLLGCFILRAVVVACGIR